MKNIYLDDESASFVDITKKKRKLKANVVISPRRMNGQEGIDKRNSKPEENVMSIVDFITNCFT